MNPDRLRADVSNPPRVAGFLLTLLVAPAASFGAAPDDALESVQVTATRRAERGFDVSPSVTTLADAQLRGNAPRTVADHFRGEPGTFVQQTTPGQGIAIVRGLKGSEVLHMVDGFRINNAIFRNAPNQYIALVDPWNLERIEVVRGPMAALYGGDAMGGVVHFLTRSPTFDGAALQARAKFAAQAASADSSSATQLEGEIGNRNWSAHGGATWQDAGRLRVGGGDRLPFTEFRSFSAHGKLRIASSRAGTFLLQAQFTEQPETARYDALVPGFGQSRPDSAELLFKPQRREFAQLRWRHEPGSAAADSVDIQMGSQRITDVRVSRDSGSSNRDIERNASLLVGGSALFVKRVHRDHEISYGAELYHDTVSASRERVNVDSANGMAVAARFPDGSSMEWIGLHASDRWDVHERLTATLGARTTRYRVDVAPTATAAGAHFEPNDISGNVGLLFRATPTLHFVGNVGRGFRPPNIFDLGTFGPRGNRFNLPNADLDPESVMTFDVGAKLETRAFRADLSVFRSHYHDKITQVLTGGTDASGRLVVQSRNATGLRIEGVEADARWYVTSELRVRASATWTRGEEEFGGEIYPADRIPPLFGLVSLRYTPRASWIFEGSLHWATRQDELSPRDFVDPRINPAGTAGWASANLRVGFEPSARVRLALGVQNLADRRYREHGSGFDAAGRSVFATGEWGFGE
jgi:hemoglobin/transferrin/lactoferrin receptor protein